MSTIHLRVKKGKCPPPEPHETAIKLETVQRFATQGRDGSKITPSRLPSISPCHFLLPILPVPRGHVNTPHSTLLQTSIIDIVALGIAPRDRQGRDAARFAKHVLRGARSELIHFEILTALEGCEGRFFDDEALETWRM